MWLGSKFEFLKKIPSPSTRGNRIEKIIDAFLEFNGFDVEKISDFLVDNPTANPEISKCDRVVDGYISEYKASMAWENKPFSWKWQQLRDQPYDRVIIVGINPDGFFMWWCKKEDILDNSRGQHAGSSSKETKWFSCDIEKEGVPPWFREMETWYDD